MSWKGWELNLKKDIKGLAGDKHFDGCKWIVLFRFLMPFVFPFLIFSIIPLFQVNIHQTLWGTYVQAFFFAVNFKDEFIPQWN